MKKCKYCKSEIETDAKICRYCHAEQSRVYNLLQKLGLFNVISIVVLVISMFQCHETHRKESMAQKANDTAQIARIFAQKANDSAQKALKRIDFLATQTQKLSRLNTEIAYIERNKSLLLIDEEGVHYPAIFRKKLDTIMLMLEPDNNKRLKWIEDLSKIKPE